MSFDHIIRGTPTANGIVASPGASAIDIETGNVYYSNPVLGGWGQIKASSGGGASKLTTVVPAARIATLLTPLTLSVGLTASQVIVPTVMYVQYKFGTTQFAGGDGNLVLRPIGTTGSDYATTPLTGFISAASSQGWIAWIIDTRSFAQTTYAGTEVELLNDGLANWTGGDGELVVTLFYEVVDLQ